MIPPRTFAVFAAGIFLGALGATWLDSPPNRPTIAQSTPPDSTAAAPVPAAMREPAAISENIGANAPLIPDGGPAEWSAAFDALRLPRDRKHFLFKLTETHARQRADEILPFLKGLPANHARNAATLHGLTLLGETAPERALGLVQEHLQGVDAQNARVALTSAWGATNPREAIAWAARQSDRELGLLAVEQIISAATQVDPIQARDLLEKMTVLTPEQRTVAGRALAGMWAQSDPTAALAWVKSQGAAVADTDIPAVAYLNWATTDAASAALALTQTHPALSPAVGPGIASMWARQDPKTAAAWLATLPPNPEREAAYEQVASTWAESDPAAALSWALTLPAGDASRAEALRSVALRWTRFDAAQFDAQLRTAPADAQQEIRALLQNAGAR